MTPNPITRHVPLLLVSAEPKQVGRGVAAANDDRRPGVIALERELQGMADVIRLQAKERAVAAALAARPTPAPVRVLHATVCTETEYRAALASHDWHYDRSDDPTVWYPGQRSLFHIQAMRKRIDKNGAIWNEYAPEDFRFPVAAGSAA